MARLPATLPIRQTLFHARKNGNSGQTFRGTKAYEIKANQPNISVFACLYAARLSVAR